MLLAFLNAQLLGRALLVLFAGIGFVVTVIFAYKWISDEDMVDLPSEGRGYDEESTPPVTPQGRTTESTPHYGAYEAYAMPPREDAPRDFVPEVPSDPVRFFFDVHVEQDPRKAWARRDRLFTYAPGDLSPLVRFVVNSYDNGLNYMGPPIHEFDCSQDGRIAIKVRPEDCRLKPFGRLTLVQWDHANLCWYYVLTCVCFSGYAPDSIELLRQAEVNDDRGDGDQVYFRGSLQAGDL